MSTNEKISKELLNKAHFEYLEENKSLLFSVQLNDIDMFVCEAVFELLMYGSQNRYGEVTCEPEFRLIQINLETQLPSEESDTCLQPEINNYYEKLLEVACEQYWEKFGLSEPMPDMGRNL
tara:strand:+ start:2291 stop:2653 length:363 start_codon:yes stop_codon:yes gene_type:complete